jgi:dienelactone hydrolase
MKVIQIIASVFLLFLAACNGNKSNTNMSSEKVSIKEENITYTGDSVTMKGFVAYNSASELKRPVVLIVHEWWGMNDYSKSRAKQLADLGYLAMAIDLYGDGKTAEDPESAGKLAGAFYKNPVMAKTRFDAALAKIKTYSVADTNNIAAIGYCFGGGMVLNFARQGEKLRGVVSFHGSLLGVPLDQNLLKADVLVCHGADDKFVKPEEVAEFRKEMDAINASYTFKSYAGATHAFSNPNATDKGKKYNMPIAYNAAADTASFNEMKLFFNKIFK